MARDLNPTEIITPPARLAFPALFKPKPVTKNSDNLKYQATLLLPPNVDLEPFKKCVMAAAHEKWGDKIPGMASDKNPIKPCDAKSHLNGYESGWHYINTKTEFAPAVVDQLRNPLTEADAEKIFAGCWVRAFINAFAYHHPQGGNGVSFGLNAIQFVKTDERLDGRSDGKDVFEPVEIASGDENLFGGAPQGDPFANDPAAETAVTSDTATKRDAEDLFS